jgi:hypothetical protein
MPCSMEWSLKFLIMTHLFTEWSYLKRQLLASPFMILQTRATQVPNHFIIRHQKKIKQKKKDKNGVRIRITPPSKKKKTTPTTHGFCTKRQNHPPGLTFFTQIKIVAHGAFVPDSKKIRVTATIAYKTHMPSFGKIFQGVQRVFVSFVNVRGPYSKRLYPVTVSQNANDGIHIMDLFGVVVVDFRGQRQIQFLVDVVVRSGHVQ